MVPEVRDEAASERDSPLVKETLRAPDETDDKGRPGGLLAVINEASDHVVAARGLAATEDDTNSPPRGRCVCPSRLER